MFTTEGLGNHFNIFFHSLNSVYFLCHCCFPKSQHLGERAVLITNNGNNHQKVVLNRNYALMVLAVCESWPTAGVEMKQE